MANLSSNLTKQIEEARKKKEQELAHKYMSMIEVVVQKYENGGITIGQLDMNIVLIMNDYKQEKRIL